MEDAPLDAAGETAHDFRNDRFVNRNRDSDHHDWVKRRRGGRTGQDGLSLGRRGRRMELGKPDIVIRVPGFHVPASGQLTYRYLITPRLFPKDVWVRAAEFRIDQRVRFITSMPMHEDRSRVTSPAIPKGRS